MRDKYSPDASKLTFPPALLPSSGEEAVHSRRVALAAFFHSLSECDCWGALCASESMALLLGYELPRQDFEISGQSVPPRDTNKTSNLYSTPRASNGGAIRLMVANDSSPGSRAEHDYLGQAEGPRVDLGLNATQSLLSPLLKLGIIRVCAVRPRTKRCLDDTGQPSSAVAYCWSRDVQSAAQAWLSSICRLEVAAKDTLEFYLDLFVKESAQLPKGQREALRGRLLPHVMSALATTGRMRGLYSCRRLCEEVFSYLWEHKLYVEAELCARRGLESSPDRRRLGMIGEVSDQQDDALDDAGWQVRLADALFKVRGN